MTKILKPRQEADVWYRAENKATQKDFAKMANTIKAWIDSYRLKVKIKTHDGDELT